MSGGAGRASSATCTWPRASGPARHAGGVRVHRPGPRRLSLRRGRAAARRELTSARGRGRHGAELSDRADRPRIDDLVKEGQELVVQVTKDPFGGQGPARDGGDFAAGAHARLSARRAGRRACPAGSPTTSSASGCAQSWRASGRGRLHRAHGGSRKAAPRISLRTARYLTDLAARIARKARKRGASGSAAARARPGSALRPGPRGRRLRRDPRRRRGRRTRA